MNKDSKILEELNSKMDGSITALQHSFNSLRTGRASAVLLDTVKVEAYGNVMPINQIASVNTTDSKTLIIQVWDKNLVSKLEKAILDSGLGLTPNTEGQVIKLIIPSLSESRRKELVKKANEYSEQARISIRNIRRTALDSYKKQSKTKLISEDELKSYSEEVQKITNDYIDKVNSMLNTKSKIIMSI